MPKGWKAPARTLYLNKDERRALVENAPDEVRQLLHAMCLLPARPGELVACRVSDLDLAHSALRVPTVKTGARTVPLGKEATATYSPTWPARR